MHTTNYQKWITILTPFLWTFISCESILPIPLHDNCGGTIKLKSDSILEFKSSEITKSVRYCGLTVKIPSGYKYSCMETSDVHHKIPLYPDLLQDKDKTLTGTEFISEYPSDEDILAGIRSFLGGCRTVFCMENNEEDCQGVLDCLATRSKLPPLELELLHLPDLLHQGRAPHAAPRHPRHRGVREVSRSASD